MGSESTFEHGDGCCGCKCTDGEIGFGGCLFTFCCPCFALCNAANDAGLKNGNLYCIATLCGFGCCSLMFLGQEVEEKRGLKTHGGGWHCMHSCFDGCSCHSCRVVNECKMLEKEGKVGNAPATTEMVRN
ncbi:hypothetical protein ACHAWO_001523 [Cyclotella atomus]|uniref:Uncharacterized protein n=1 Tax=Cyclotella atomus TaxID=382360 RepID=A0ABD3MXC0_9STRA